MSITLIYPTPDVGWAGQRLDDVLRRSLTGREFRLARRAEELSGLAGQRLLLALPLGDTGVNLEYMRMLARLRKEPELLQGLLDLFFRPGEQEQREWFLERIKMDGPPPCKWEC